MKIPQAVHLWDVDLTLGILYFTKNIFCKKTQKYKKKKKPKTKQKKTTSQPCVLDFENGKQWLVCFTTGRPSVFYFDYHLLIITYIHVLHREAFYLSWNGFHFFFWVIFFFALFSLIIHLISFYLELYNICYNDFIDIYFSPEILVWHGNWKEVIMCAQPNIWN